jgi:regulator of replication initiation timing
MSEDRLKEQCDYTMKKNRELIIENEKLKKALELAMKGIDLMDKINNSDSFEGYSDQYNEMQNAIDKAKKELNRVLKELEK